MSDAALQVNRVSLKLGGKSILQDVSLDLSRGQILGVLGPNGAGKTTLLKLMSGQHQSPGKVLWQQRDISQLSVRALAREIAVLNQINDTVFNLTLLHVVRMGLLPHKSLLSLQTEEDEQRIVKAITLLGLQDKLHQEFSTLSGGEQQRALIARALVQQAPLLVLDEPVNHLDVYYQHQILQLLTELSAELGITVVMSLHDLNLAARYCDQLCLLNQGKMLAYGSPEEVFTSEQLANVFKMPCHVQEDVTTQCLRVDFQPKSQTLLDLSLWR